MRVLTPKRWQLPKVLRREDPTSIRALSKRLERDYKNVHKDTRELEHIDLIIRTEDGLVQVPWDVIDTHVQLAA